MPISAAGNSRAAGFTLIELMVVIAILGVASAAVVLAMIPRDRPRDAAEAFAARVRGAEQSAILRARPMAVWVTADGYGFEERRTGGWRAMGDKPFRVERWPGDMRATLTKRERLVFDATGLASGALDITLARGDVRSHVTVTPDGSVQVGP